jgi:hypothetical protein
MRANEVYISSLRYSGDLVQNGLVELTTDELLATPLDESLCAAWLVGHALYADAHVLERLGALDAELPDLPHDFANRFDRWDRNPLIFPAEADELPDLFAKYRASIIRCVGAMDDQSLDQAIHGTILPGSESPIPYSTQGTLLSALTSYTSMLSGNLSAIRQALGYDPTEDLFDDMFRTSS